MMRDDRADRLGPGHRSIPLQSAYCAAKAAVRGFTDSLRTELIHDGSARKASYVAASSSEHAASRPPAK